MATGPPVLTLVATPLLAFTVATFVFALVQVGAGAEAIEFPRASLAVALNLCVVQRGMDTVAGSTETIATTCCTITGNAELAIWFDVWAVTCAVPLATAVTTPPDETVAIEVASLVQVNVAPGMALPPESKAVPTSDAVAPRLAIEAFEPPPEAETVTL